MVAELLIFRCDNVGSDEKEVGSGDVPSVHMTTELSKMEEDSTEGKHAEYIEKKISP